MATASEMRQWLHDNGRTQSMKGRISAEDRAFYDAAHGDGTQNTDSPDDFEENIGVSAADFPGEDEAEPDTIAGEQQPKRVRTRKPAAARARSGLVRGLLGSQSSKTKKKPGPRKPPRVSLEKFTSRGWTMLGRMAMSVSPPTGRCLQAQAPMAGVILNDIARDTVADRILQPLARAEDKLDKVFALTAPPLIVMALDMSNGLPPGEQAARQAILVPMLREALRVSLEVTESYAEQITMRLEQNARYDAQIDKLIAMIFGQVEGEAEQAEDPEPATMSA
jgi:hypothetical protein